MSAQPDLVAEQRWWVYECASTLEERIVADLSRRFASVDEYKVRELFEAIRVAAVQPVGTANAYPGDDDESLEAWLRTALRDDLRSYTRREAQRRAAVNVDDVLAETVRTDGDPLQIVLAQERHSAIADGLRELPGHERQLLRSRSIDQLDKDTILDLTGWTDRQYKRYTDKLRPRLDAIWERAAGALAPLIPSESLQRAWATLTGAGGGTVILKATPVICTGALLCGGVGAGVLPNPISPPAKHPSSSPIAAPPPTHARAATATAAAANPGASPTSTPHPGQQRAQTFRASSTTTAATTSLASTHAARVELSSIEPGNRNPAASSNAPRQRVAPVNPTATAEADYERHAGQQPPASPPPAASAAPARNTTSAATQELGGP